MVAVRVADTLGVAVGLRVGDFLTVGVTPGVRVTVGVMVGEAVSVGRGPICVNCARAVAAAPVGAA